MIDLLNQPGFQRRVIPLSVKAWHQMIAKGLAPERAELIRGVIVEKMPKSILHIKLAGRLFIILLEAVGSRFWVRKEDPLSLEDSEPEPDLSVIEGREEEFNSHPSTAKLVVEVSVSTLAEDRAQAPIYAEAGVEEYWIINGRERCIEVFRKPGSAGYEIQETHTAGQTLLCAALPGVSVDVAALFQGLPEAEA